MVKSAKVQCTVRGVRERGGGEAWVFAHVHFMAFKVSRVRVPMAVWINRQDLSPNFASKRRERVALSGVCSDHHAAAWRQRSRDRG